MLPYHYFLIISLFASLWRPSIEDERNNLRYFPIFLLITLVGELYAAYLRSHHQSNLFLYNIQTVFEFEFYFFFLGKLFKQYTKSKIITVIIYLYLLLALTNIFFIQGKFVFHSYTFNLGCFIIIPLCIIYFIYLLRFSKSPTLTKEPEFWIVTGIFFYHTMMLPIFGIHSLISNLSKSIKIILFYMVHFVNISQYILFTIGFLCKRKIPRLSL